MSEGVRIGKACGSATSGGRPVVPFWSAFVLLNKATASRRLGPPWAAAA